MKKTQLYFLGALFGTLLLVLACSHQTTQSELQSWRSKMQLLAVSLSDSLPYVMNASQYYDSRNYNRLLTSAKETARLAREIDREHFAADGDPNLKFLSQRFAQDMTEMARQFENGNRRGARLTYMNVTNYCVSCHTRSEAGHENLGFASNSNLERLALADRVLFLFAVRQYDEGLKIANTLAADSEATKQDPRQWQSVMERAIAVAVRVKQDPILAQRYAEEIRKNPEVPSYIQADVKVWLAAIHQWRKENSGKIQTPSINHEKLRASQRNKMYAQAKGLIQNGEKYETPSDAGLIYYLRASTLLHRLLNDPTQDVIRGASLYLAGTVSRELRELDMWSTQGDYFEACIRYLPHTEMAQICYAAFEKSVLASLDRDEDIVFLPDYTRARMQELKQLSTKESPLKDLNNLDIDWRVLDQYTREK